MISSKKFDLIAIVLTALVLVGTVCAMFIPKGILAGNATGVFEYSDLHSVTITADDYYTDYVGSSPVKINLMGDYADTSSKDVKMDGSCITILGGGVYVLSGTLNAGSVIIDSANGAEVRIILNGVNITSSDNSPVYVRQSAKTVISLVDGTANTLTDNSDVGGAIYSKDDLVINGSGSLAVNANFTDGIKANDTLKITNGNIEINAVDDGINANNYFMAINTSIAVNSGGDAVKCEHAEEEKGFIAFEESKISVTSGGDGVCASSGLYLNNTDVNITSGGGSKNAVKKQNDFRGFGRFMEDNSSDTEDTPSTKAIKAGTNLVINGGNFNLDSAEDAIHSDKDATVNSGVFEILSGDDAVHAEINLDIAPQTMNIKDCYEGLEGAYITINGGEISIVSKDDAINASGENSNGGMMMPPGSFDGEEKSSEEDIWLTVNGGHVYVETSGDGFDSNGSALINGGYLEIYGPENSGNGSVDVGDGGYVLIMNGGKLFAVGSSGMAEHPVKSSKQQSLTFYLDENYDAGSTIKITDGAGDEIISGTSGKRFNWVCVSDETLTEGETYTLVINGIEVTTITANGGAATTGTQNGGFGRFKGERPENFPTAGEMPQREGRPQGGRPGNMEMPPDMQNGERPADFPEEMSRPHMIEQEQSAEEIPENGFLTLIKTYTTPIISVIMLALAFVFVVFYKRKSY